MSAGRLIKTLVKSMNAPDPVGPYSHAIKVGDTVYVSGCIGVDKATHKMIEGGFEDEAKQVMKNLGAVLEAASMTYDNVVKATIFLDDINNIHKLNEIYKKCFSEPFPARSCIQVSKLPMGAKVEIEAIAVQSKF